MSAPIRALLRCAVPLLGLSGVLAGCAELDPLTKEGAWRPVGANDINLRAMVAVPGDLVIGRAARDSDGNRAARAVDRLRTDQVYPLPAAGISKIGSSSAGAAAPAAAPAGAAP